MFTNVTRTNRLTTQLLALAAMLLIAGSAAAATPVNPVTVPTAADEHYYVVLFGQQSADNEIKWSHTFAAFVHTAGGDVVATHSISWFPVSENVSLARSAETGVNKSWQDSIAWAEKRGLEVTVNGPFEIQPELFRRAARQVERLASGEVKYKVYDRSARNTVKNCIHAVADIVDDGGFLQSGTARGQDATRLVVEHFRPYFVTNAAGDSTTLLDSLGLRRFVKSTRALPADGGLVGMVR